MTFESPTEIRVRNVGQTRVTDEELEDLGLPFLADMIRTIQERQAAPAERILRWYQDDLIRNGYFEIPSPVTQAPMRPLQSVALANLSVFYQCFAPEPIWVGGTNLGAGFPLDCAYLPDRRLLVSWGHPVWGVQAEHARTLETVAAASGIAMRDTVRATASVVVLTGDFSFAHHMWNQLSALDRIADTPAAGLDVLCVHEPLGRLEDLFPEQTGWRITRRRHHEVEGENRPGLLYVPLGSSLVTTSMKDRLRRHIARTVDPRRARKQTAQARIWISIRTRNRTATNQVELICGLCEAIAKQYPGCEIVLDGHSLSEEAQRLREEGYSEPMDLAAQDQAVAASVKANVKVSRRDCTIISGVGLGILESIAIANSCDFYVCHHGTVQHKIGWFAEVPGVVHCNAETLRANPAPSVADNVEGGFLPVYAPPELVEDATADGADDPLQAELRHGNYRVSDVPGFCSFVLQQMAMHIAPAPPTPQARPKRWYEFWRQT